MRLGYATTVSCRGITNHTTGLFSKLPPFFPVGFGNYFPFIFTRSFSHLACMSFSSFPHIESSVCFSFLSFCVSHCTHTLSSYCLLLPHTLRVSSPLAQVSRLKNKAIVCRFPAVSIHHFLFLFFTVYFAINSAALTFFFFFLIFPTLLSY